MFARQIWAEFERNLSGILRKWLILIAAYGRNERNKNERKEKKE